MLRIIQNTSAAGAKSYYSTADYYTEGQELEGHWRGEGAALGPPGYSGTRCGADPPRGGMDRCIRRDWEMADSKFREARGRSPDLGPTTTVHTHITGLPGQHRRLGDMLGPVQFAGQAAGFNRARPSTLSAR